MKTKLFILLFVLGNCVSINKGDGTLTVNYSIDGYDCVDERGYHTKFLQCNKEYHIKHLMARETILKNHEADTRNQMFLRKIEDLIERKDYKRALTVSASIVKNSKDEGLVSEANALAKKAYLELQLQEYNKEYPESKFVLNEGD